MNGIPKRSLNKMGSFFMELEIKNELEEGAEEEKETEEEVEEEKKEEGE